MLPNMPCKVSASLGERKGRCEYDPANSVLGMYLFLFTDDRNPTADMMGECIYS